MQAPRRPRSRSTGWGFASAAGAALLVGCTHESREPGSMELVGVVGETGRSPGQLIYPRAVDTDGRTLWVIDKTARVQRLDPESGQCLAVWRMPRSELGMPTGVTAWPRDPERARLYVPDTHYHRVVVYEVTAGTAGGDPTPVATFGAYGQGPGQFIYPTDVAILPAADGVSVERIYVSEYGGRDRVSVFDAEYNFLFSFGEFGSPIEGLDESAVQFNRPQSIAIEPTLRELVVTDACNHRVGRLTLDGELIAWIGSPETAGSEPGEFKYPYGLLLPGDGTAMVTEFGNNRVQHIDLATGRCLAIYGGRSERRRGVQGPGEPTVTSPWGITRLGSVAYVLDSGRDRVVSFRVMPTPSAGTGRGG